MKFTLDSAGVQAALMSPACRAMVDKAAQELASNLRGQLPAGVEVDVRSYTTDRAAASVAIAHPSGRARQLRDGSLTRAAGQMGLTVRSK